jgi:serine/threonine protein kinase
MILSIQCDIYNHLVSCICKGLSLSVVVQVHTVRVVLRIVIPIVMASDTHAADYMLLCVCAVFSLHYRDLKPENLLVSKDGTIKITDFGLSASCGVGENHRRMRTVCGTPYYTDPSVFNCNGPKGYDGKLVA